LVPLILAAVASSFKGTKPDGTAISKWFEDQKENIANAMPSGFSANAIPGFKELAKNAVVTSDEAAANVGNGLGQLLVPGAVIAALVAAIFFLINNANEASVLKIQPGNTKSMSTGEQPSSAPGEEKSSIANESIKP
jgi:hypothetical protein